MCVHALERAENEDPATSTYEIVHESRGRRARLTMLGGDRGRQGVAACVGMSVGTIDGGWARQAQSASGKYM